MLAQTSNITPLPTCYGQSNYYFCNQGDVSAQANTTASGTYGYCCPNIATPTEAECIENASYKRECSYTPALSGKPLYYTYWPGMTPEVCGSTSHDLVASSALQSQVSDNLVLQGRSGSSFEACYWKITPEANTFTTSAYIDIYLDAISNANFYVYKGTDRRNASAVIEGNVTAVVGAPYRVNVGDGAIVVLQATSASGSGSFSYQVIGAEYPWFEKPFIGQDVWLWYMFAVAVNLVPILILAICVC